VGGLVSIFRFCFGRGVGKSSFEILQLHENFSLRLLFCFCRPLVEGSCSHEFLFLGERERERERERAAREMGGGSGVQYEVSSSCPTDVHCVSVSSSCCCGFGKEAS